MDPFLGGCGCELWGPEMEFEGNLREVPKHQTKILPCGIGGLLAERGLEFGVDRGDCV